MKLSERLETLANARRNDSEFFREAFTNPMTGTPQNVPADIRKLSERLCRSYNIRGICDPMYIANVIALELGRGDGMGKFN